MRLTTRQGGAFKQRGVQLTDRERAAFKAAAAIASQIRILVRTVNPEFEDTNLDTILGELEYNHQEFEDGFIPCEPLVWSPVW